MFLADTFFRNFCEVFYGINFENSFKNVNYKIVLIYKTNNFLFVRAFYDNLDLFKSLSLRALKWDCFYFKSKSFVFNPVHKFW